MRRSHEQHLKVDEREAKLPKWAQEKISGMRRAVYTLDKQLSDSAPDLSAAKVVAGYYSEFPQVVTTDPRENIYFFAREYDESDWYSVRLDGDDLLVMGADSIQVAPQSGNAVRISFQRGTHEDAKARRLEAIVKGWSTDEIRQGKHLGHIPQRWTLGE